MASNYLEQLVAEWYEYQGYFIRRNIMVGKRDKGGYECELDIVGFHPEKKHLVHIEPTSDAHSWSKREERYNKKFHAGKKYIPGMFKGLDIPDEIEQICLLGYGNNPNHPTLSGGKVMTVSDFLTNIISELASIKTTTSAIPENYPLIRTLQYIANKNKVFSKVLGNL